MEPARSYLGHRSKTLHSFFLYARGVFFLGLGVFMAIGDSVPSLAQGFVAIGVLVLLCDALELFWPSLFRMRANAATLGEDGLQTPEGFVGWHRVLKLREVVTVETPQERVARLREERKARKERRRPHRPRRLRMVVIDQHEEKGFKKFVVYPKDVKGVIEDANARLARRRRPTIEPANADYRSSAEAEHEHPRDAALDTALPPPERVAAFLSLDAGAQARVLAAMADEKGIEVFERRLSE